MKNLFSLIFLFSVLCSASNGQSISKPVYIGGFSPYYEDPDGLYHDIEATGDRFRTDPNGFFVVRVCSTTPLPIAVTNAAGLIGVLKSSKTKLLLTNTLLTLPFPNREYICFATQRAAKFIKICR